MIAMKGKPYLRLVAEGGNLVDPQPAAAPPITDVNAALAVMRLCVGIVQAEPADLRRGFTDNEFAAQMAAVDRMVHAFRVLDRLLTAGGQVSTNGHLQPTTTPTKRNGEQQCDQ